MDSSQCTPHLQCALVRDRVATIAGWVFSLLFVVLAAQVHLARGGPQRPKTIMSNSGMAPKNSEAALLLLAHAAKTLPPYARVAVIKPRNRSLDDAMLMAAHGQLPKHHAVLATDAPDFVIALEAPLEDPRYELMHEMPAGGIWKRVR